jgi:16S rRNA processing protein RimM
MIHKEETVKVGYFAKPHGIKGELSLVTEFDLFEGEDEPYLICEMDGILVPFFLESYRYKSNSVILVKMEDVDDNISAKKFVNQEVFYPANRMKVSLNDEPSWKNFTGYMLEDKNSGTLGIINEVDTTTINTLLKINYQGKETLVPIADELVDSVNQEQRILIVSLPDGVLDL